MRDYGYNGTMKKTGPDRNLTVAIEISEDIIKIAAVALNKKSRIVKLASASAASLNDASVGKMIAGLFEKLAVRSGPVLLNIPRHMVMTRFAEFPSLNDTEIRSMVDMEVIKHTPYSSEDIVTGYKIIGKNPSGYSRVFITFVKKEIVERYRGILLGLGFVISKAAVGTESLAAWAGVVWKHPLKEPSEKKVVVNVDAHYVTMIFLSGHELSYTRSFKTGGILAGGEKTVVDEVMKTIAAYQRQKNTGVTGIFVTGAPAVSTHILPFLQAAAGVPVESVPETKDTAFENVCADMDGVSFAEVIGLATGGKNVIVNLLPEEIIKRQAAHDVKKDALVTGILLAGVIVLAGGLIGKNMYDKIQTLRSINKEIKAIRPEVEKIKKMRDELKVIREEVGENTEAVRTLTEIYKLAPQGFGFSYVDYDNPRYIIIKGNAPSLSDTIKFSEILEQSPAFKNVSIKYTAQSSKSGAGGTEFEIMCGFERVQRDHL